MCQIISANTPKSVVTFHGDATLQPGKPTWANYVKGNTGYRNGI